MEKMTCAWCLETVRLGPQGRPARHGWTRKDPNSGCPGDKYPVLETSLEGYRESRRVAVEFLATPPVLGDSGARAVARALIAKGDALLAAGADP